MDISDGVLVHDGVHWEGVRLANFGYQILGIFPLRIPYSGLGLGERMRRAGGGSGTCLLFLLSRMLWFSARPTQSLVVLSVWLGTSLLRPGDAVGRVYFPARRMVQEENGPQSAADVGAPTYTLTYVEMGNHSSSYSQANTAGIASVQPSCAFNCATAGPTTASHAGQYNPVDVGQWRTSSRKTSLPLLRLVPTVGVCGSSLTCPVSQVSHSCRTELCVTVMRLPRSQTRHLSSMLSFGPVCSLLCDTRSRQRESTAG